MPEPTFLQIHGADRGSTRMLELPSTAIRIGRAGHCEVQLNDPRLGEVQCLLKLRGNTWHFQPVGPSGLAWIDGRPAEHQVSLKMGVPFQVGSHWLTLRSAENAFNDWNLDENPTAIVIPSSQAEVIEPEAEARQASPSTSPSPSTSSDDRLGRWQSRVDQREKWLKDRQDEKRWEARWKAAGETIRARGTTPQARPEPVPTPPPAPVRPVSPRPSPGERRPVARIVEPRSTPPIHRVIEPTRHRARTRDETARLAPSPAIAPEPEAIVPRDRPMIALPSPGADPIKPPEPLLEDMESPPIADLAPTTLANRDPEVVPSRVDAGDDSGGYFATVEPPTTPAAPRIVPSPTLIVPYQKGGKPSTFSSKVHRSFHGGEPKSGPSPMADQVEAIPLAPVEPTAPTPMPVEAETPLLSPSILDREWAEITPFVADTFDSSSAMHWGEQTTWQPPDLDPDPEPDPEPIAPAPAPARRAPSRVAPEPTSPAINELSGRAVTSDPLSNPVDWPSAQAIFAAQGQRVRRSPDPLDAPVRRPIEPIPTDSTCPAHWSLPTWLGVVPTASLALVLGLTGLGLTLEWVKDSSSANLAMKAALRGDGASSPRLDLDEIPRGGWWSSTASHRAAWAVALERLGDGTDHSEEVRMLLEDAKHASPLSNYARFVVEASPRPEGDPSPDIAHLGRSRDVVTLTWAARKLKQAGQVEASLRAYRSALEIASSAERGDLEKPSYSEAEPLVRRYGLPHESLVSLVTRDMVGAGDWTYEQWVEVMPRFALAPLTAALALRTRDKPGSDRLLDLAIRQGETPPSPAFDSDEHRAATAEAHAALGRWTDSAEQYRLAIDLAEDDPTRRAWCINLAEVARRLGDDKMRLRALESAKALDSGDEITKKALALQQNLAGIRRTQD